MTARAKRAVRVTPGTASDRRGTGDGTPRAPPHSRVKAVFCGKQGAKPPIENSQGSLATFGLAGGLATKLAPRVALQSMGFPSDARDARGGALLRSGPQSHVSTTDSFSVLYELQHHRGALEILLLLNRENSATKSGFRKRLRPGPEALGGALRSLFQLGLVQSYSIPNFPFTKTYRLTERGRALLEAPLRSWPSLILQ